MTSAERKEYFTRDGLWAVLAALAIAFYFWRFTRYGLRAGFTFDDLMNLGRAIRDSYGVTLRDMLCFWRFSDSFRPFGSLFYRIVCDLFGFDPFPFRVACHVLLAFNLVLVYRFFRFASGGAEVPLLMALILAYRRNWPDYYSNTGFCYDLLCFPLYFGALWIYLRARTEARLLTGWETAAFLAMIWLGINAKEMMVSVPAVLATAELFWLNRPAPLRRRFIPLLAAGAMVTVFIFGRVLAPGGLPVNDAYRLQLTPAMFFHQTGYFVTQFLDLPAHAAGIALAAGALALLAWAWIAGPLAPRLAAAIAFIGVLPVAFIPDRGLAAVYIPAAGAAFLIAWAPVQLTKKLIRFRWRPVVLFTALLVFSWWNAKQLFPNLNLIYAEGRRIQAALDSARALDLRPPKGAWFLLEKDPFPDSYWSSTFLFWILYRDPAINVDRSGEPPISAGSPVYYAVLTTRDGRLLRVR